MVANVAGALRAALRGRECLALSEGQKVATPRTRAYHHPDCVVVCGTPLYDEHDEHAIVNPTLLVEVLSPSPPTTTAGASSSTLGRSSRSPNTCSSPSRTAASSTTSGSKRGKWLVTEHREGAVELELLGIRLLFADVFADLERLGR